MRREKANAKPPNSMVLIEPPMASVKSRHTRAESGIDSSTAKVARGLPRKRRIISPVRTRPIEASLSRFLIASLTKIDWSKTTAVFRLSGISTRCLIAAFMPFTIVMVLVFAPLLEDWNVHRPLPIDANDVVLQRSGVFGVPDIGNQDG